MTIFKETGPHHVCVNMETNTVVYTYPEFADIVRTQVHSCKTYRIDVVHVRLSILLILSHYLHFVIELPAE